MSNQKHEQVKCPFCKGRGGFDGPENSVPCAWCNGSGEYNDAQIRSEVANFITREQEHRAEIDELKKRCDLLVTQQAHDEEARQYLSDKLNLQTQVAESVCKERDKLKAELERAMDVVKLIDSKIAKHICNCWPQPDKTVLKCDYCLFKEAMTALGERGTG